jgi:hypothetical protein
MLRGPGLARTRPAPARPTPYGGHVPREADCLVSRAGDLCTRAGGRDEGPASSALIT